MQSCPIKWNSSLITNVYMPFTLEYNQKLSKLPVPPPDPSFKVSDEILQLVDNVKEKIKY